MLEKCLVGFLVGLPPHEVDSATKKTDSSKKSIDTKTPATTSQEKQDENQQQPPPANEIPVMDSYQTIDAVHVVLYTKCKNLSSNCLIIDKAADSSNAVVLHLYTWPNCVYKYKLDMAAPTKDDYDGKNLFIKLA
jgi:hypothetical protein